MSIAGTTVTTTHLPFPEVLKAHQDQLTVLGRVMSREEAEELLQGKSAFTYIVRLDVEESDGFELSWVMKTGEVEHRHAQLIKDGGKPYWRNKTTDNFNVPITADEEALLELFSKMMGCDQLQMRTV